MMKKLLLILFLISTTAVAQNTRFNIRSDVKIGDSAVGMSSWASKYASPFWVYTNFLLRSDTALTVATKYDLDTLAANIVYTESDPIFALDSNAILHWYDSILKIATKYDIDTLTFLRSFTETDPIFALDSANILHWYDTVAKIATYYSLDTLTFLRSETLFINDSANLVHFVDTTTTIATQYDLSQLVTVESDPVWLSDSTDYMLKTDINARDTLTRTTLRAEYIAHDTLVKTGIRAEYVAHDTLVKTGIRSEYIAHDTLVKTGLRAEYIGHDTLVQQYARSRDVLRLIATDTANQVRAYKFDAAGDLLVGDGNNSYTKLAKGANQSVLKMWSGVVGWHADSVGAGGSGVPADSVPFVASSTRGWIYPRTATDSVAIGKTVPTVALDVNGSIHDNGTKVINHQEINNTIASGKGLNFDGTNDYVSLCTSTQLDLGTGDGTYFVRFQNTGNDGADNNIFGVGEASTKDYVEYVVLASGKIAGYVYENNVGKSVTGALDIGADLKVHSAAFSITRNSATGLKLYLDGNEESYTQRDDISTLTGSVASTGAKYIGVTGNGTSSPFKGSIYNFRYFNCALTASEIKNLSEGGATPFYYTGASNTALTSGTLVIGKKYLIKTYVASDNFTNVGAASNAAGVSFIATGTTPTTWTNSSNLLSQGEILSLDPQGMSTATWYDQSGNGIDGTVSGASLYDVPEHTVVDKLQVEDNILVGSWLSGLKPISVLGVGGSTYGTSPTGLSLSINTENIGDMSELLFAHDINSNYIYAGIHGIITGTDNWYAGDLAFSTKDDATATATLSERMRITSTGNVGIGTTAPDEKFVVVGASTTGKYTSSGWTHSSDSTMKDSIRELKNVLGKLKQLQGVKFVWKEDTANWITHIDTTGFTVGIKKDTIWKDSTFQVGTATVTTTVTVKVVKEIKETPDTTYQITTTTTKDPSFVKHKQNGFIAQSVEKVIPEAVRKGSDGKYSIADGQILPIVVEAAKELSAEIDTLNRLLETQIITPDTNGIRKSQLAKTMYISLSAPVVMPKTKQIADGWDGREITLVGMHNTNNLTLHNQDNIRISTATIQLKKFQTLTLVWAAPLNVWVEKSRSLNQ